MASTVHSQSSPTHVHCLVYLWACTFHRETDSKDELWALRGHQTVRWRGYSLAGGERQLQSQWIVAENLLAPPVKETGSTGAGWVGWPSSEEPFSGHAGMLTFTRSWEWSTLLDVHMQWEWTDLNSSLLDSLLGNCTHLAVNEEIMTRNRLSAVIRYVYDCFLFTAISQP